MAKTAGSAWWFRVLGFLRGSKVFRVQGFEGFRVLGFQGFKGLRV